jgi:transcription antitermination protein NusB
VAARTKARRRALEILFEADQRRVDPLTALAERAAAAEPAMNPYVATLVEGVTANQARIDELLSTYSQGWDLDRMPAVDRCALRLGTYELLWQDDVPDAVVLDEAVELVKTMSTDESPSFVNGLLARILELKPTLSV